MLFTKILAKALEFPFAPNVLHMRRNALVETMNIFISVAGRSCIEACALAGVYCPISIIALHQNFASFTVASRGDGTHDTAVCNLLILHISAAFMLLAFFICHTLTLHALLMWLAVLATLSAARISVHTRSGTLFCMPGALLAGPH